jgi:hypothetical protein
MSVSLVCCGVQFPDSTVQCTAFTGGGIQYVCGIACGPINAGDPVSLICQQTGAVSTTLGYGNYTCIDNSNSGTAMLRFSDTCFASIVIQSGGCCCYPCAPPTYYCGVCNGDGHAAFCGSFTGCICVRAHTVGTAGVICSTTCLSLTCNTCISPTGPTMPVLGCSGTTGAFLTWFNCLTVCGTNCNSAMGTSGLLETFLCYCTTTCTISIIRQCTGTLPGCSCNNQQRSYYFPYKTPDGKYLMTFILSYACSCCVYNMDCQAAGLACGNIRLDLTVKATTDSVCYLGTGCANSCTVILNSILPATCAHFGTGAVGACQCNCGCVAAGYFKSFAPFSYGPDGWLLMHYDVCNCTTSCCVPCLFQRYWGIKPISDQCYAMTCNYISPENCGGTIVSIQNNISSLGSVCGLADGGYIWDQGDCIKRQFVQFYNASGCGSSPCCAPCAAIQCFQIGAGPCICFLGCTRCTKFVCSGVSQGLNCLHCTTSNFAWITPKNQAAVYNPYSAIGRIFYNNPCCAGVCDQVSNGTRIWFQGTGFYLNALYRASIPYCYQCACYYFGTTEYAAAGMETSTICCSAFFSLNMLCMQNFVQCCCTNCSCLYAAIFSCAGAVRGAFNSAGLNCWCAYNWNGTPSGAPNIFRVDCCYLTAISSCTSGLLSYPAFFKSNSIIGSFTPSYGSLCSLTCSCQASTTFQVVNAAPANIDQFIGIAQNTVSDGGTSCYAVAGMLDTSPFATRLGCFITCNCYGTYCCTPCGSNQASPGTSSCAGSVILGFYSPMQACTCGGFWFTTNLIFNNGNQVMCPVTQALFNGVQCDCFKFTYYGNDNLRFIPHYDAGLGKWTSTFHTHCRNFWCCCIICCCVSCAPINCCFLNFNN